MLSQDPLRRRLDARLARHRLRARHRASRPCWAPGPIADAFVVALRLPNHFRAIFGEGAFNAAFVPTYARVPRDEGAAAGAALRRAASSRCMLVVQVVLLAAALPGMPWIVAPAGAGLRGRSGRSSSSRSR